MFFVTKKPTDQSRNRLDQLADSPAFQHIAESALETDRQAIREKRSEAIAAIEQLDTEYAEQRAAIEADFAAANERVREIEAELAIAKNHIRGLSYDCVVLDRGYVESRGVHERYLRSTQPADFDEFLTVLHTMDEETGAALHTRTKRDRIIARLGGRDTAFESNSLAVTARLNAIRAAAAEVRRLKETHFDDPSPEFERLLATIPDVSTLKKYFDTSETAFRKARLTSRH